MPLTLSFQVNGVLVTMHYLCTHINQPEPHWNNLFGSVTVQSYSNLRTITYFVVHKNEHLKDWDTGYQLLST